MDFDITTETITPLNTTILTFNSIGGLALPTGTNAQRPPSPVAGVMRWNTTKNGLELYDGATWNYYDPTVAYVSSVAASGGTTGLTFTGSPITTSGTLTLGGTLSISNGGTGSTSASAAFNALSPLTTTGDLLYEASTGNATRLAIGTSGQVLTVVSGLPAWATVGAASFSVLVGPSGSISWTLVSGNTYTAIITHNLGTQNVVVQAADISNNDVIGLDKITVTSASQITIRVAGPSVNTKTLRVVIIANGASIAAGASTPSSIILQNNGVALSGTYTTVNFVGSLSATNSGSNVATVTNNNAIIRTLSYVATSLDSPNNSDWAVNALAPTVSDPVNPSINVRQFSNTAEQGIGLLLTIPSNATNIQFVYRGRPQIQPVLTTANLQMNLYYRSIPNNAALGSWVSNTFPSVVVPLNANTQYYTYGSVTLASLGLVAGTQYQFELTRINSVSSNLTSNWLMSSLDIVFT